MTKKIIIKEEHADLFKALSCKTRSSILSYLLMGESDVGGICYFLRLEQSHVSHALRVLRGQLLVNFKVVGNRRVYSVNEFLLRKIFEALP